jgi:hypothetical protein
LAGLIHFNRIDRIEPQVVKLIELSVLQVVELIELIELIALARQGNAPTRSPALRDTLSKIHALCLLRSTPWA